jgi:hypothetical protein
LFGVDGEISVLSPLNKFRLLKIPMWELITCSFGLTFTFQSSNFHSLFPSWVLIYPQEQKAALENETLRKQVRIKLDSTMMYIDQNHFFYVKPCKHKYLH